MAGLRTVTEIRQHRSDLLDRAEAINDLAKEEDRDLNAEEQKDYDALLAEADGDDLRQEEQRAERRERLLNERIQRRSPPAHDDDERKNGRRNHAVPRHVGHLKNFKGTVDGRDAGERAYRFGMFALSAITQQCVNPRCKFPAAVEFAREQFEPLNVLSETGDASVFVPSEFGQDLIDLRVQYGVFRQYASVVSMSTETRTDPRRVGGLTAYFVAENAAGTESDASWDSVELVAKDLMVLSRMSAQLSMDSVVSIGDRLAGEIAYAFANKEDDCGFRGTGTSTFGGIYGVVEKLTALTAGTAPGLILGAGNLWSELTLANFHSCVGALPTYARMNARWHCTPIFYNTVMETLAYASGGVPATEIINGVRSQSFLGYPVVFNEVMRTSASNSTVPVIFGDLALAATFGDRQQESIAFSDTASVGGQSMWERNQIGIRGIERFDINVHDVGSDTVAGPIVGIELAAS